MLIPNISGGKNVLKLNLITFKMVELIMAEIGSMNNNNNNRRMVQFDFVPIVKNKIVN